MIGRIRRYNWSDRLSIKLFVNGRLGWFCYADLATLSVFGYGKNVLKVLNSREIDNVQLQCAMCRHCCKLLGKKRGNCDFLSFYSYLFINFMTQLPFLFNFIQDNTYWVKRYNLSPWLIVRLLCSKSNDPLLELSHEWDAVLLTSQDSGPELSVL